MSRIELNRNRPGRKLPLAVAACFLLLARPAFAHRIDEYLQATLLSLQPNRLHASMRLIPGVLVAPSVIAAIDSNGDGLFSPDEERAYAQRVLADLTLTLDGRSTHPQLLSWSLPQPAQLRDGLGEIHIEYAVDLPPGPADQTFILTNHHRNAGSVYLVNVEVPEDPGLQILAQKRNQQQTTYELDYRSANAATPFKSWKNLRVLMQDIQFASLFHLGMNHIAEGTDHLLFLLTLLLPAPLLARGIHTAGNRWGPPATIRRSLLHILGIVTAFTLGHSITLSLAALHVVSVPSRPIEVLIAVSIFVSALHALRPIIPGKEAWIAVFFGLIHGLAFASTLDRLGLERWQRVGGILAFNLGIEVMQLLVVCAVLPSLILLSRTRAYSPFRITGAILALVASTAWIAERLFHRETSIDTIINAMAAHAPWFTVALFLVSLACKGLENYYPPSTRSNNATSDNTYSV